MTAPYYSKPHKVSEPDTSTESQVRWLKANNFTQPEAYVQNRRGTISLKAYNLYIETL